MGLLNLALKPFAGHLQPDLARQILSLLTCPSCFLSLSGCRRGYNEHPTPLTQVRGAGKWHSRRKKRGEDGREGGGGRVSYPVDEIEPCSFSGTPNSACFETTHIVHEESATLWMEIVQFNAVVDICFHLSHTSEFPRCVTHTLSAVELKTASLYCFEQ